MANVKYNNLPDSAWNRNFLAGVPPIKKDFLALQVFNILATVM
jgi:hypothetical protein